MHLLRSPIGWICEKFGVGVCLADIINCDNFFQLIRGLNFAGGWGILPCFVVSCRH